MPATSQEPSGRFALRSGIQAGGSGRRKEGVGETSGQTAGSSFAEFAPGKPVRQKKQVFFVRCGSVVRNFIGLQSRKVKSGPDVFADALVRIASAAAAWQAASPNHSHAFWPSPAFGPVLSVRRRWLSACGRSANAAAAPGVPAPMVIIWRNRRVNRILRPAGNPRQTATFSISRLPRADPHSPSIHRDT